MKTKLKTNLQFSREWKPIMKMGSWVIFWKNWTCFLRRTPSRSQYFCLSLRFLNNSHGLRRWRHYLGLGFCIKAKLKVCALHDFFNLVVVFYYWLCFCVVGLALFLRIALIMLCCCFYSCCTTFIFLVLLLFFLHYFSSFCYLCIVTLLFSCCYFTLLMLLPRFSHVVTLTILALLPRLFLRYCFILFSHCCLVFFVLLLLLLSCCYYLYSFCVTTLLFSQFKYILTHQDVALLTIYLYYFQIVVILFFSLVWYFPSPPCHM